MKLNYLLIAAAMIGLTVQSCGESKEETTKGKESSRSN